METTTSTSSRHFPPTKMERPSRRKSLNLFSSSKSSSSHTSTASRPARLPRVSTTPTLQEHVEYNSPSDYTAPSPIDYPPPRRRRSHLNLYSPASDMPSPVERENDTSPELGASASSSRTVFSRPRTMNKVSRTSSLFGSFKSHRSRNDDDDETSRPGSRAGSLYEGEDGLDFDRMTILHHGEVQSASGFLRRRNVYQVLTNTHVLRFKNQAKAQEAFPNLPMRSPTDGEAVHVRANSTSSADHPHHPAKDEKYFNIPLSQIVAVYRVEDGKSFFHLELASLNESTYSPALTNMYVQDAREGDIWLSSLRAAAEKTRLLDPNPIAKSALDYVAKAVELEHDYSPERFQVFRAVRWTSKNTTERGSADDVRKIVPSLCYVALGYSKIHLIPLPRPQKTNSSTSMSELLGSSHHMLKLTAINFPNTDDAIKLSFRAPCQSATTISVASNVASDIAIALRSFIEWLRPNWREQPFTWTVPPILDDALPPEPDLTLEEYACFDRTFAAYCQNYEIDPAEINYMITLDHEEGPLFQVLPHVQQRPYSILELLAILRSLRYNECFGMISFANVKLDSLHDVRDKHGSEDLLWTTRAGAALALPRLPNSTLLVQEFQMLAVKSTKLRRFDFTNSLTRSSEGIVSTGICEAISPLCALKYTNVDWLTLNGLQLSELDLEYIYRATLDKSCQFRAIELANSNLNEEYLDVILEGFARQRATLETFDISGCPVRLAAEFMAEKLDRFERLKHLSLSRLNFDAAQVSILSLNILRSLKLETLDLSGTNLNRQTVDVLTTYLRSSAANMLGYLNLSQCQLSGEGVAAVLEALARPEPEMSSPRLPIHDIQLDVSANRIERGHSAVVAAIENSMTPAFITLSSIEYSEEKKFRKLLSSLISNTSIKFLDISRVSLPLDASEETCNELRKVFENNTTLRALNISGEQAHLEAVTLGQGLCYALKGLSSNTALTQLWIEHQSLGLPGAHALASVLENNHTLTELYIEDNNISLQAFTTLVNALETNKSLLYLSNMDADRTWSRRKVDREVHNVLSPVNQASANSRMLSSGIGTLRRGLHKDQNGHAPRRPGSRGLTHKGSALHKERAGIRPRFTEQDVAAAMTSLEQTWEAEVQKMQSLLQRNYFLAIGVQPPTTLPSAVQMPRLEIPEVQTLSPMLAPLSVDSPSGLLSALHAARMDRTPTAEVDLQLGASLGAVAITNGNAEMGGESLSSSPEDVRSVESTDEDALLMKRRGSAFEIGDA